jgi:hypothetical protein
MLEKNEGSYLTVTQAYKYFCQLAQTRQLAQMKWSMFKATMADLMKEQFGLPLRRDVANESGKQQEARRGVKLIEVGDGPGGELNPFECSKEIRCIANTEKRGKSMAIF